ncbi:MAG: Magnesium transporter MgtE [uncultured Thiotrichaceae bacterium]|uniref:Magnesium transporter MgtE n=1 Tax=uncultured Thiotrichaceae bacterium TaxID=298394 RepID=A0A6S6TBV9_9GAMM|nr:MAG: Magnesium transporter MgtE [uncultured Thiotrichaceae bacterium]
METSVNNNYEHRLSYLYQAIESGSLFRIQRMLNGLKPGEIAHLIEASPPQQRKIVWELVEQENEGAVLVELGDGIRASLMEEMDVEELTEAVQGLSVDDMADFLQTLPQTVIHQTLSSMDRQDRERVQEVLGFDEDTAGGLMDTQTVTVKPDVTVDVVLRYLRRQKDLPSHLDRLFVVNNDNIYQGSISLVTLLTHQPDEAVQDIMDENSTVIHAATPSQQIALIFEDRDLVSAPVVEEETQRLLGRITIDDVVDVIREEAEQSVKSMAGLNEDDELFAPVLTSARRRAVWLGTNLLTAFMAAWVIGQFETTINSAIALAALMGVIPSMGGIAGSQTLTLVVRGIALGQVGKTNTRSLFLKEIMVGLLNGLVWALVVFAVSAFVFKEPSIGIVVAIAMLLNLIAAPIAGVTLPVALKKMGIDPALAGSVLLTTVTDIIGYAAVLGLAALSLPYWKSLFG